MSQTQLYAWCREKGLFEHQLKAWRDAFCSAPVILLCHKIYDITINTVHVDSKRHEYIR
jgi:hypothetical protein